MGVAFLAEGGKPDRLHGAACFEGRPSGLLHQVRTVDEIAPLDQRHCDRLELCRHAGGILQQTGPRREGWDQRLAQAAPFVTRIEECLQLRCHRLRVAGRDEDQAQERAGPDLQSGVAYGPAHLDRPPDLALGDRHPAPLRRHPAHPTVVPNPAGTGFPGDRKSEMPPRGTVRRGGDHPRPGRCRRRSAARRPDTTHPGLRQPAPRPVPGAAVPVPDRSGSGRLLIVCRQRAAVEESPIAFAPARPIWARS